MNELIAVEQAEYVKKWCREYGFGILIGIIFAVFISWGWNYWRQAKENNLLKASMQYEHLIALIGTNENISTVNRLADGLLKNFTYTPYASLAALQLAKLAVNKNNLTEAENKLIWVIDHGHNQTLQSIARLRLARILLTQNQANEALNILSQNEDKAYIPIFFEEKGDILNNLGHSKQALQSYLAAKQAFGNIIELPLLEMKINNLAYV